MSVTVIRPLALVDADELAALYVRNREFLRAFEPDRDERFFTAAGQRARAEEALRGARTGTLFRYVIVDHTAPAGLIALENVLRGPRNLRPSATGLTNAAMAAGWRPRP